MHDIERGGNTTARRLAALAALRNAQAEDASGDAAQRAPSGRGTRPVTGRQERGPGTDPVTAPRLGHDMSSGVYEAVEAAVKRSRLEFIARLAEYRAKLDCEAIRTLGPDDAPAASLDEAQFVAHRIAGLGKTLGFADLGDTARQTEAAITAYKLERSSDLRQTAIARICRLSGLIEATCNDQRDCPA